MALRTALALLERGEFRPAALMLFYPVIDHYNAGHPTFATFGEGFGLSAAMMRYSWESFVDETGIKSSQFMLNRMNLSGLAPTYAQVAEYDVLRDEGEVFTRSLANTAHRS